MPLYPVQLPPIGSQSLTKSFIPTSVSPSAPKREGYCSHCNQATKASTERPVRLPEALRMTGLSRSTFLDRQNPLSRYHDPDFPQKIPLGPRAVGWAESELIAWLESRRQVAQKGRPCTHVGPAAARSEVVQAHQIGISTLASTTNKKGA